MKFERPLVKGRLIKRYKRFLADVTLENGETASAHCANPGAMLGLNMPGLTVWLEPNDDPKRKLRYAWKLVELEGGDWAGIDTSLPNKLVGEALAAGAIPELSGYDQIRREVRYGKNSRIDFLLTGEGRPDCYLEVKNVHLRREGDLAEFPDSVTKRGAKHLEELGDMADAGARAVMLYVVQMTGCRRFALAADIDPAYAAAYERARSRGVEALCRTCRIALDEIVLDQALPMVEKNQNA